MVGHVNDIALGQTGRKRLGGFTSTFDATVDGAIAATITTNGVVEPPSREVDGEI